MLVNYYVYDPNDLQTMWDSTGFWMLVNYVFILLGFWMLLSYGYVDSNGFYNTCKLCICWFQC